MFPVMSKWGRHIKGSQDEGLRTTGAEVRTEAGRGVRAQNTGRVNIRGRGGSKDRGGREFYLLTTGTYFMNIHTMLKTEKEEVRKRLEKGIERTCNYLRVIQLHRLYLQQRHQQVQLPCDTHTRHALLHC